MTSHKIYGRLRKLLVCLINKEQWDRNQRCVDALTHSHTRIQTDSHTYTHAHWHQHNEIIRKKCSADSILYSYDSIDAHFKATVSLDGFVEKIKAPFQYAEDLKVSDAIIYLCKLRGTSLDTRQEQTRIHTLSSTHI